VEVFQVVRLHLALELLLDMIGGGNIALVNMNQKSALILVSLLLIHVSASCITTIVLYLDNAITVIVVGRLVGNGLVGLPVQVAGNIEHAWTAPGQ